MPLPTNLSLPPIPYIPEQALANNNKIIETTLIRKEPISPELFQGYFNWAVDKFNSYADEINGIVAGAIPGSDDPNNQNKFVTTDGAGNVGYIFVGDNNVPDGALSGDKIADGTLGTEKFDNQSVTEPICADNFLIARHVANGALPWVKLNVPDNTIPWVKLNVADGQIPAAKINFGGVGAISLMAKGVVQANGNLTAGSAGVQSVNKIAQGIFRVNFTTANANFIALITVRDDGGYANYTRDNNTSMIVKVYINNVLSDREFGFLVIN